MKRIDLIREIEKAGCRFLRHGGNHDCYVNPSTGMVQFVPRHNEIHERLARRIIAQLTRREDHGAQG